MTQGRLSPISKPLRMAVLIAGVVGAAACVMALVQIQRERRTDIEDVDRRAHALAYQASSLVREALRRPDTEARDALGSRIGGFQRLIGFGVYRPDGRLVALPPAAEKFAPDLREPVSRVVGGEAEVRETKRSNGTAIRLLATRVAGAKGSTPGVLVVLNDVSYVDERALGRLARFAVWIVSLVLLLLALVVFFTWATYDRPLSNLAEWMRSLRTGNAAGSPPVGLPGPLLASESDRLAASLRAARAAALARSRAAVRSENVWTRERLRDVAIDCLGNAQLIVVSNREPYMHQLRDGVPRMVVPPGGLVTALDPVLQACGGLWVAHGAGDADRRTSDDQGRLTVPPGDSRYTLRRVWLSHEEEQGYYYGLANEGLWPLCHLAHERPVFRSSDWEHYVGVNRRFAETVLEEIGSGDDVVLVQDYQLALVPRMLKAARPDLRVGLFWHIPWPPPEVFRICPWRAEILHGMLGADLAGFHLQQYCNNFLDTVDRMVEARLDRDAFAVELKGHTSIVRAFPIGVESWSERSALSEEALAASIARLRERHRLEGVQVAVGVDRIDYTKGLPERFRAVARFLEKYPQHRERFTFVELGAPSRTHLQRYRNLISELESLADEINWKFRTDSWSPILFLADHHDSREVHPFLRMASVCIVSSLHDGMNLVAKEYVASQADRDGVLVLSDFAGAARELSDAVIINPYDSEQFADAIRVAVEMDAEERRRRMERMRRTIEEQNVYRWAANFLTELAATRST